MKRLPLWLTLAIAVVIQYRSVTFRTRAEVESFLSQCLRDEEVFLQRVTTQSNPLKRGFVIFYGTLPQGAEVCQGQVQEICQARCEAE